MTEAQLKKCIETWQDRLGLNEWRIIVDLTDPLGDEHDAQITRSRHYSDATLNFHPNWVTWDKHKVNQRVVHELLHLILREQDFIIFELVEGSVPSDIYEIIDRSYRHHNEAIVDNLSHIIVKLGGEV